MRFIACADYGAGRSGPDHRAWPALGTRRCQSSGAAAQVRTGVTSGRSASGDPNGGVIYQLGIIGQAVVAFAATNIDDIVLLTAYFDQPNVRPQHVIVGQYLGFGALVGLSALGAIGVTLLPEQWAGALGLVPIALGIRGLLDRNRRTDTKPDPTEQPSSSDRNTTTATTSSAVPAFRQRRHRRSVGVRPGIPGPGCRVVLGRLPTRPQFHRRAIPPTPKTHSGPSGIDRHWAADPDREWTAADPMAYGDMTNAEDGVAQADSADAQSRICGPDARPRPAVSAALSRV